MTSFYFLSSRKRKNGFSLALSIVLLLAMSLIGIGLFKKSGSATDISQGFAFRSTALASADVGLEAAFSWILSNAASLNLDSSVNGYYARYNLPGGTVDRNIDFTGNLTPNDPSDDVDWKNENLPGVTLQGSFNSTPDASGTTYSYIIQRMCDQQGVFGNPTTTVSCITFQRQITEGLSNASLQYGQFALQGKPQIYYRVTVKAFGPKGATSYLQGMLLVDF